MPSASNIEPFNTAKSSLKWILEEEETEENAIICFAELIGKIRSNMQIAYQQEEEIMMRIEDELRKTEKTLDTSNFQRLFDQSVARLNSEFDRVEVSARQLASSLDTVSALAQSISGRVATLDLGKNRVVECLQRVNDLRDLGTCANGVQEAIKREKYEEAASHIHRFLTLDTAVFKMGDNAESRDVGYSVKNSYEVLREANSELKQILESRFDEAKASGDIASMERYFKLFPLINEHTSGLQRFGVHLCAQIVKMGEQNYKIMRAGGTEDKRKNVLYADTLTLVFEGIARLIELHQPIISNYYGADKLLIMIEIIQPECDRQSGRVLTEFVQKRNFEEKARQVRNLINARASIIGTSQASSIDRIDAIELDSLLSEVTLMHTRAELFWRFLKRRLNRGVEKGKTSGQHKENAAKQTAEDEEELLLGMDGEPMEFESEELRREHLERAKKHREERARKLDTVLNRSGLSTKMQELLGKYVLMEQYYMTESVHKAIAMDNVEDGAMTSSLLDDVFFIVRKSIRRSISSSSVDCVCAMINNGATLLETDFLKYISAPIKSGYPSAGWSAEAAYQTAQSAYNVMQGKSDMGSERQRAAFLVSLNNLRASVESVNTLKTGLTDDFQKHLSQISDTERKKLENAMSQFEDFTRRLEQHANLATGKLCEAAFRPKVKSNAEAFLELPHCLNDEQLAEFELNDPFTAQFIVQLDRLMAQFESMLLAENYQALLAVVAAECVQQMERVLLKCSFNRLGALQLDKEFRELSSYLTSVAGWNVREKCTRLSQMIALLNSESLEEALDFLQHLQTSSTASALSPGTHLTLNDIRRILQLRSEFPREQIGTKLKTLKL